MLASIAAYYRRVTTAARPMNRLIAAVMLGTLAAIIVEIVEGDAPRWVRLGLARARGGPDPARRRAHGAQRGAPRRARRHVDAQTALARSIFREHLLCFAAIAALLVVQLSHLSG